MPGQTSRPYSVGQNRARREVKTALKTQSNESKLRRLERVVASKSLDRKDALNVDLIRVATGEIGELKMRLATDDDPPTMQVRPTFQVDAKTKGAAPGERPSGQDPQARNGAQKAESGKADYSWLRTANEEEDRAARRAVSIDTERACDASGYMLGSGKVSLVMIEDMIENTKLISPSKGVWPEAAPAGETAEADAAKVAEAPKAEAPKGADEANSGDAAGEAKETAEGKVATEITVAKATVFEESVRLTQDGKRVVALNAASAFHIGGGFKSGGRHALEEAMCVQSTLFGSLRKGAQLAERYKVQPPDWVRPAQKMSGADWLAHIPDDGCVLSPHVEIFREGTNEGYPFMKKAVMLEAVVSVAMPNKNNRMSDSPVDAHPDDEEYTQQLQRKWRAVFTAASKYTEADTLVVADAGCGVFCNPADQVGAAFGQVLRAEFADSFKQIVIAFPGGRNGPIFAEHAVAAFEDREVAAPEPADQ